MYTLVESLKNTTITTRRNPFYGLPVELLEEILMTLPMWDWPSIMLVNRQFHNLVENNKYDLDLFLAGLERSSSCSLHKQMPLQYGSRWENFDSSAPITVHLPQGQLPYPQVIKGHLVFVINNNGTTRFHLTRLPSLLMDEDLDTWVIDLEVPINCGWDFCPLLGLFVVTKMNGHQPFEVFFLNRDQKNMRILRAPVDKRNPFHKIYKVELLFTSKRLAAKVKTPFGQEKIIVWDWKNERLCLDYFEGRRAQFIDEYRLLCDVQGDLVLWDFTMAKNPYSVTFKMEPGSRGIKRIQRSYDLLDTKPFRVDPEAGIVVLEFWDSAAEDVRGLVIPTELFVGFKTHSGRRSFEELWKTASSGGTIGWEKWTRFAEELKSPQFWIPFHNHLFTFGLFKVEGNKTRVVIWVTDFALCSRNGELDEELQKPLTLCLKAPWTSAGSPLPPAVTRRNELCLETTEDPETLGLFPTEDGVLFVPPDSETATFFKVKPIRPTGTNS